MFSAPNYCGEFDNAGAILSVDEVLKCRFHMITACSERDKSVRGSPGATL